MAINVDITEKQMDRFLNSPEVKTVLNWVFEEDSHVTSECEYCEVKELKEDLEESNKIQDDLFEETKRQEKLIEELYDSKDDLYKVVKSLIKENIALKSSVMYYEQAIEIMEDEELEITLTNE